MSRFLFVSTPFTSHVNPLAAIAMQLTKRGHDLAWVIHPPALKLLPAGGKTYVVDDAEVLQTAMTKMAATDLSLALYYKAFFEEVVMPLARSMRPCVEEAIADFRPDVMVVDHHALAGAIAARKACIPWATSSPSGQMFTRIFDRFVKLASWQGTHYDAVQRESGLEPVSSPDTSPQLVLLYTTPAFVGSEYPPSFRFVGAAIEGRVDTTEFPWEQLRVGRRILVSLGSIVADRGERFFAALQDALRDADLQVIVSAPAELLPEPPANFLVRDWLPLLDLLPKVDAVITHGGSTVNEALAFGVPMVVVPMTNDQFIYARRVTETGVGVRVRFRRVSAEELRDAVLTVIETPSFGEAARGIQASYAAAGGADAAADAVEELASAVGRV